jgi:hypothetical protein
MLCFLHFGSMSTINIGIGYAVDQDSVYFIDHIATAAYVNSFNLAITRVVNSHNATTRDRSTAFGMYFLILPPKVVRE